MQQFIDRYREQINGVLTGFDRLVFRGSLRRLNYGCWDQGLQSLVAQGWSSTFGKTMSCSRTTWIT